MSEPIKQAHEQKPWYQQLAQGLQHYGREFVALWNAQRDTVVALFSWRHDKPIWWNVFEILHQLTNVLTETIRTLPYTISHLMILYAVWRWLISPLLP